MKICRLALLLLGGCSATGLVVDVVEIDAGAEPTPQDAGVDAGPTCDVEGPRACDDGVLEACEAGVVTRTVCPGSCDVTLGCLLCVPGATGCLEQGPARCADDGSAWIPDGEVCDLDAGAVCRGGACVDACTDGPLGHFGCTFWALDLDNSSAEEGNAAAQAHGLLVENPWPRAVRVWVEVDDSPFGAPAQIRELRSVLIPPRDHEAIVLPPRELDGSSLPGANDGTHTALSSNAFRVRSDLPVAVVQANPMEPGTFSADTALLLPERALGRRYTVVGWPQTLADGDTPETDFDATRLDEDLRAFLTVVGTEEATRVRVAVGEVGPGRARVVAGGPVPALVGGDVFEIELGPFDVLNLETQGLNADLTGTFIEADRPVVVFSGSEASDAPVFETYARRTCCADHLEEQLLADRFAGRHFVVGRQHPRRAALGRARGVRAAAVEEREWVRIVGVADESLIETELAGGPVSLRRGQSVIVEIDRSFELSVVNAAGAVHVLSVLGSQDDAGVRYSLPGGDPATVFVPPTSTFERLRSFVVPPHYPFDFATIVAPWGTEVKLDGVRLEERAAPDGSPACVTEEASAGWVAHRCQLSFPDVSSDYLVVTDPGVQGDGRHLVSADRPVGVTVSGFASYESYAHQGGVRL